MALKKPKRPKAPKHSSSLQTWQAYERRLSDWTKKCSQIIGDRKRKAQLIEKLQRKRLAF